MSLKQKEPVQPLCPKTGKCAGAVGKHRWLRWVLPVTGLVSLIWFLIRVIPKPSRATYPCQRLAFPLASGLVIWVAGAIGSMLAYRRARHLLQQSRYVVAAVLLMVAVMAIWLPLNTSGERGAQAAFIPSDPPNSPIGVAKGIHPGRVVWVHEPDATSWNGSSGSWWDDDNTDQDIVNYMVSQNLRSLTGQRNDGAAWDALFRHFNRTRGLGDIGYEQGERITIKINMNQDSGGTWRPAQGMPSPHVIHSMLDQLINVVGVPGSAITIYDASRYIGDPIYNKVRSNPDPNFQQVTFVTSSTRNGRIGATYDAVNPLYTRAGTAYLPRCVTQAKYLINMSLLRAHSLYGVTLSAKNHFGSTYFPNRGWTPEPLHNHGGRGRAMGTYNCLVNLNGHKHLAGKTLLYMVDALYSARNQSADVIRFTSFGGDWCSSLFVSQDPVAIDSVGLDFLRNEPTATDVTGYPDNYMHEAALANNPDSGTVYDPENDGERLESLGVHEHWNNPTDKQYSRNLGVGNGIELLVPSVTNPDGPVENAAKGARYDYIRHAIQGADPADEIVVGPGTYGESIDFNGKNLTVRSTDPNDPAVVAATVIDGGTRAVTFSGGENQSCVLAGLTITGADNGIYCSGATPTVANCRIIQNRGAGIKLWNQSNPTFHNCIIAGNGGAGIDMTPIRTGRFIKFNYATVANCTIVGNREQGIYESIPTVTNSILYYNGAADSAQIDAYSPKVTYSNVQGGMPGTGNIEFEPGFVVPGYWADPDNPGVPAEPGDAQAIWVAGDYHLRWDSLCVNAGDPNTLILVGAKDIDGEPRIMAGRPDIGCDEVGQKQTDFTRNGIVDALDVETFVNTWLASTGDTNWDTLCDLYEDGHIDLVDWAEISKDWLWRAHWY